MTYKPCRLSALLFVSIIIVTLLTSSALAVDTQAHRKKFLNASKQLGFFTKIVVDDSYPQAYVTPKLLAYPHGQVEGMIAVVYHYYYDMDPKYDRVIVREAATGRKIGEFSKHLGGLRMYP